MVREEPTTRRCVILYNSKDLVGLGNQLRAEESSILLHQSGISNLFKLRLRLGFPPEDISRLDTVLEANHIF